MTQRAARDTVDWLDCSQKSSCSFETPILAIRLTIIIIIIIIISSSSSSSSSIQPLG